MILFKRKQLTQEYFLQHVKKNDVEETEIYLRETITQVEYFDKKLSAETPSWYLVKNQKKSIISDAKSRELESHWQKEMESAINKEVEQSLKEKESK